MNLIVTSPNERDELRLGNMVIITGVVNIIQKIIHGFTDGIVKNIFQEVDYIDWRVGVFDD